MSQEEGVVPSSPRFVPSIFIAHRVQQSHCSSVFHRVSVANSRSRAFRKSICAQEKVPTDFPEQGQERSQSDVVQCECRRSKQYRTQDTQTAVPFATGWQHRPPWEVRPLFRPTQYWRKKNRREDTAGFIRVCMHPGGSSSRNCRINS